MLTLTSSGASATVAQFQAALRAVTYRDTAAMPSSGMRTVNVTVHDGTDASVAATRAIEVEVLNRAPSFLSGRGTVTTAIGTGSDEANSVLVQADGKIVVGGYAEVGQGISFALSRYNADGTLDTTFGSGGKLTPIWLPAHRQQ